MANRRDLQRFLDPLLESDPMLIWSHPYLFVGPIRHIALVFTFYPGRGIQSFGMDAGALQFVEHELNCDIFPRITADIHILSQYTNVYDNQFKLCFLDRILRPAIDALRQVDSCQKYRRYCDFESCTSHRRWTPTDEHIILADLPLGEFEQFHRAWPARRRRIERRSDGWYRPGAVQYMAGLWDAIDRGDIAGLAGLMHDWERARVEDAGIARLWAPSPFPFEEPAPANWRDIDASALEKPFREIYRRTRAIHRRRRRLRELGLLPD